MQRGESLRTGAAEGRRLAPVVRAQGGVQGEAAGAKGAVLAFKARQRGELEVVSVGDPLDGSEAKAVGVGEARNGGGFHIDQRGAVGLCETGFLVDGGDRR